MGVIGLVEESAMAVPAVQHNGGSTLIRRKGQLHELLQGECRRRVVRQRHGCELRALLLRHVELHAPAEQHPRDDPVLARDARDAHARLVALQREDALFVVAEEAPDRRPRRLIPRAVCQAAFGRRSVSTSVSRRPPGSAGVAVEV